MSRRTVGGALRAAIFGAGILAAGAPLLQAWAIDYPVDVATTRWALLDDATGTLLREDGPWPRLDGRRVNVPGTTWLLRIEEPMPAVDQRIFEVTQKKDIKKAANEYRISYVAKWRSKDQMEAMLDQVVTQHSQICAQGLDIQSACAAAAGIAQQLADGDLSATDKEKRRARKCSQWVRDCVKPNEANGDALLTALRTAYQTRNDAAPAPIPNLDAGWTDAPPVAP